MNKLEEVIIESNMRADSTLAPYACKSIDAIRLVGESDEEFNVRPMFFRDADRILHSTAYTRYMDKTQVFSLFNNDLITHRGLHVQFVSKIARTIGRSLLLNEDLIEAIALGHDLGHVPFGHSGEKFLNEICVEEDMGIFLHNVQSVRVLQELEKNGNGLNITLQVLDGILCHNGEIVERKYQPNYNKTAVDFIKEYEKCGQDKKYSTQVTAMTLEGCVVRISDVIAYIGRDIEDAIAVNLIKRSDIPKDIVKVLGNTNTQIIDTLVEDLLKNSFTKPYLELSEDVFRGLKDLLDFNYKNIYTNPKKEDKEEKMEALFRSLYKQYMKDLENKTGEIYENYYKTMSKAYTNSNISGKIVVDFIAGMTDKFFIEQYKKNFLPRTFDMTV